MQYIFVHVCICKFSTIDCNHFVLENFAVFNFVADLLIAFILPPPLLPSLLTGPVAEYRPPFDDLVPSNPSIDDMKRVVVDWQKRPEIPKAFTNHSVS